ncbi:Pcc1-domain-containing protein [Acaromyces ingoldii]|uniref:Pcc1-domain-containing protein n=1 Tax=Acaromyces ingoldii TaxID=215250 RepID=A0A316Z1S9_9BASI|nr:Pcc1-domain-containing protein [Acaromyces ingoldii]PWN94133.1 Pcc1-domain-containing protein [Acaromyces ingoldii]
MALPNVPTGFAKPPEALHLPHSVTLNIPLPSAHHAATLYRVLSVDKPLRPKETFIAYRAQSSSPETLDVLCHCSTVRQLRLASNSILEDIKLVLATMDAFPGPDEHEEQRRKGRKDEVIQDAEFELNGTGRAG